MNGLLNVSVSPHIHTPRSTRSIMLDVIIALLPTTVAGTVIFGLRSLAVVAVCVGFCVLSELVFELICKKEQTISDLSAIVSGMILALSLPVNIPLWQAAVGSVFAMVFVKCIFGGIGQNFANPAVTARVFMIIAFSGSVAKAAFPLSYGEVDAASSATPLAILEGTAEGALPTIKELLLGIRAGSIGETCTVALLAGGIYLLIRKVITWHTPVVFVATVYLFTLAVTGDAMTALQYTLSGGLFIGAIFMATDYSTTPTTEWGMVVFGLGAGILTVAIRIWGTYPEGISFAILLMNILTPYIEKLTARKPFGGVKV